jgi:hypothetical protein
MCAFIPDIRVSRYHPLYLGNAAVVIEMESAFINAVKTRIRINGSRYKDNNSQTGKNYRFPAATGKKEQSQRDEPGKAEQRGQI